MVFYAKITSAHSVAIHNAYTKQQNTEVSGVSSVLHEDLHLVRRAKWS